MALTQETCIPCTTGAATLSDSELVALLPELPGWEVIEGHHLQKAWTFADFQQALAWVNRAGAICEAEGHHAEFPWAGGMQRRWSTPTRWMAEFDAGHSMAPAPPWAGARRVGSSHNLP